MFDLLSSEYGWTDEQMLELTLARLRLSVEMVQERRREEHEVHLAIAQVHAQAIVGAMPGLAQSKKAGKAIAKYASKLAFVKRPKELPRYEDVMRLFQRG